MKIKDLDQKKICFLGFGIEQEALLKFILARKIQAQISVCDARDEAALNGRLDGFSQSAIDWRLGKNFKKDLSGFDVIFRVPGYPLSAPEIIKAKKKGALISSPTKLFFDNSPTKNIIAVTGTKGKGTTSGLIVKILQTAKKSAYWGGNVGVPIFCFFDKLKKTDYVVLELSSFQLEDLEASPHIAVITNLYPEHLSPADPVNPNFHQDFKGYCNAKLNILSRQSRKDYAVISKNLSQQCQIKGNFRLNLGKAQKIYFEKKDFVSRLAGDYNQENIGAAYEVAKLLNIKEGLIKKGVKAFRGLPHRLEFAGEKNKVKYYDNSIATTPESVAADINSFAEDKILIVGGADKGADFKSLALAIKAKNVKRAIVLPGQGSKRLLKALEGVRVEKDLVTLAKDMKQAVYFASREASAGDVVLLSPACASFGLFKDYRERGRIFQEEVKKL